MDQKLYSNKYYQNIDPCMLLLFEFNEITSYTFKSIKVEDKIGALKHYCKKCVEPWSQEGWSQTVETRFKEKTNWTLLFNGSKQTENNPNPNLVSQSQMKSENSALFVWLLQGSESLSRETT